MDNREGIRAASVFRPLAALLAVAGLALNAATAQDAAPGALQSALGKPLGVTAQDVSTWTAVFNKLEALDAAADQAWLDLPDRAAYDRYRKDLHAKMIAAIGGLPEKTPLNARTVATLQRDGYRIEKVVFESMPGIFVTANLFHPDAAAFKAPYPAVVMSCGHSELGKDCNIYLRACVLAVRAGFVAFMYDPYEQGERRLSPLSSTKDHCQIGLRAALLGGSMAQLRIWDAMQAVSLAAGRPEVDARRIGFMGQSGGGTVTALMTAADWRLKATAPSCYLTTLTSLCEHMGPQDAEQNIFGQLAFGLNHTGYVLLPDAKVAVTAKFSDMFTYYGTRRLFRIVESVAAKVGSAGSYALNAGYGVHGWTEGTEQGSVDWMRTWLRGEEGLLPLDLQKCAARDVGFSLADADLGLAEDERGCTPTGRTADLPGARTIYDVFRAGLARAEAGRRPFATAEARAAAVRRLAAIQLPEESRVVVKTIGEESVEGLRVTHLAFIHRDGLALPAELVVRAGAEPTAAVLSVGREGRAAALAAARGELDAGKAVLVADLSGLGSIGRGRHVFYGATDCPEEGTSAMLYLMGESMVGRRATDILAVADWLSGRGFQEVSVVAKNDVAIAAAHAFAAKPGAISSVRTVDAPPSWAQMLSPENDGKENLRYTFVVNGALNHYDWPELLAPCAERRQIVVQY